MPPDMQHRASQCEGNSPRHLTSRGRLQRRALTYAKQISLARAEKRIGFVPYDESLPVSTAWDLGYNDSTTIWFFQVAGKEIHLIDYVEGSGESLAYWLGVS